MDPKSRIAPITATASRRTMIAAYQQPHLLLLLNVVGVCVVYISQQADRITPDRKLHSCPVPHKTNRSATIKECTAITLKKGRVESKKERQTAGRTSASCDNQIHKKCSLFEKKKDVDFIHLEDTLPQL